VVTAVRLTGTDRWPGAGDEVLLIEKKGPGMLGPFVFE
jgi:hypothetical protein